MAAVTFSQAGVKLASSSKRSSAGAGPDAGTLRPPVFSPAASDRLFRIGGTAVVVRALGGRVAGSLGKPCYRYATLIHLVPGNNTSAQNTCQHSL
jgi:hypothetical protein